eukprot:COSAG05_NODE_214_length_13907_cov_28.992178_24_plen_62_part_00
MIVREEVRHVLRWRELRREHHVHDHHARHQRQDVPPVAYEEGPELEPGARSEVNRSHLDAP